MRTCPRDCCKRMGALSTGARALLTSAAERLGLTARGYHRVSRVARTIADLDESRCVGAPHVAEALRYRTTGEGLCEAESAAAESSSAFRRFALRPGAGVPHSPRRPHARPRCRRLPHVTRSTPGALHARDHPLARRAPRCSHPCRRSGAQVTVMKAGKLVDTEKGTVATNQIIIIRDGKIDDGRAHRSRSPRARR